MVLIIFRRMHPSRELTIESSVSFDVPHLVHLKMIVVHDIRDVLSVSGPHTSRHVKIGRPGSATKRFGHVCLHGAAKTDRPEAVVAVVSGIQLLHLDRSIVTLGSEACITIAAR